MASRKDKKGRVLRKGESYSDSKGMHLYQCNDRLGSIMEEKQTIIAAGAGASTKPVFDEPVENPANKNKKQG